METQAIDPKRLSEYLNTLRGINAGRADKTGCTRFKIQNKLAPEIYKDADGNRIVAKPRVAYVAPLMEEQYKLLVQQRCMVQRPVDAKVLEMCVRFLTDKATRPCMLFYGPTGTGKTTFMRAMHLVIGMLYDEEVRQGEISNKWVKASELGALLKNDKEGYKRVRSATCLFIDDLGFNGEGEVVNDYGVKARPIEDIMEHRYDSQLMTVCTTNLDSVQIRERYGVRVYSRIMEMFAMVPVVGQDFRLLS